MIREAVVAGYFYPGRREVLLSTLKELIVFDEPKKEALGIVVPHAGYMYSGRVAGKVYGKILPPDVAIILGPNHTGLGEEIALFPEGSFLTPLGEVPINSELLSLILDEVPWISKDKMAHLKEHSLEVQLPFLQYINPKVEIIALSIMSITNEELEKVGSGLARAVKRFKETSNKRVLFVASSDFSHYEPQPVAMEKDNHAIKEILKLSEKGLLERVHKERISMCGVYPVALCLVACKHLGAKEAMLIDYKTSGDVTQDYHSVVGYGGIVIF